MTQRQVEAWRVPGHGRPSTPMPHVPQGSYPDEEEVTQEPDSPQVPPLRLRRMPRGEVIREEAVSSGPRYQVVDPRPQPQAPLPDSEVRARRGLMRPQRPLLGVGREESRPTSVARFACGQPLPGHPLPGHRALRPMPRYPCSCQRLAWPAPPPVAHVQMVCVGFERRVPRVWVHPLRKHPGGRSPLSRLWGGVLER